MSRLLFAQCPSGKGLIVTQETFGTGPSEPLPAGRIPFTYVTVKCPNDGQYTIARSVSDTCYTATWHGAPSDRSGNGNMLVVNAPYPGEFYRQTVNGLCNGTTYVYSFWIANLNIIVPPMTCDILIPHNPDITIIAQRPDGSLIDSVSTGVIDRTTSLQWRQFGFSFTIPGATSDSSSVVIRLVDKEKGGCGNDFVMDDLTLTQCSDCFFSSVFVPDAFTPNGDGLNDVLEVYSGKTGTFLMTIYDRWGSVVFSSQEPLMRWDGTYKGEPCAEGAYTWLLTYEGLSAQSRFKRTGRVLLLR